MVNHGVGLSVCHLYSSEHGEQPWVGLTTGIYDVIFKIVLLLGLGGLECITWQGALVNFFLNFLIHLCPYAQHFHKMSQYFLKKLLILQKYRNSCEMGIWCIPVQHLSHKHNKYPLCHVEAHERCQKSKKEGRVLKKEN